MQYTHFSPDNMPSVLTADLCHHTIGIPGESYVDHAACPGHKTVAEVIGHLEAHADDETILCICACHQKPRPA